MNRLITAARGYRLTIGLAALAIALMFVPDWHTAWQLDREAVQAGGFGRLLSGHFVHWNGEHLFWDTLMFVCLAAVCERRDRAITAALIVVSGVAISAGFLWFQPELAVYRGLSGIDSALFAMMLVLVGIDHTREGNRLMTGGVVALGSGFVLKTCYEYVTGATLFVDSTEAGFTPLPLSHLIGAACGLIAAVCSLYTKLRWNASPNCSAQGEFSPLIPRS